MGSHAPTGGQAVHGGNLHKGAWRSPMHRGAWCMRLRHAPCDRLSCPMGGQVVHGCTLHEGGNAPWQAVMPHAAPCKPRPARPPRRLLQPSAAMLPAASSLCKAIRRYQKSICECSEATVSRGQGRTADASHSGVAQLLFSTPGGYASSVQSKGATSSSMLTQQPSRSHFPVHCWLSMKASIRVSHQPLSTLPGQKHLRVPVHTSCRRSLLAILAI